jgi:Mrp family chromosome partitioning ATPase
MIRTFKSKKLDLTPPLTLPLPNNQPGMTFPFETIEQVRYLLARIQQQHSLPPRLSVLSALSGEGVTFVSYALAAVLAHDQGVRTCIVDLNWYRPFASPLLIPKNNEIEFYWPLDGDLTANIFFSGWPNLALFHLGPVEPALRPVLARSHRLVEIMDLLHNQFDYLVLDIPAILSTSDSVPLASLAQAGCLVIQQGATQAPDVRMALDEISSLPILGSVLNQARFSTPAPLRTLLSGRNV